MSDTPTTKWVNEPISPYKLANFLSAALSEALETKVTIAPQQLYGAARSGSLETTRFDSGHMKVTPSVANAFIQARIDRQMKSETEAEAEAENADEAVAAS